MDESPSQPHRKPAVQGAHRPAWKVAVFRLLVRALGWQLRGQLPPQFWRTTLVMWAPRPWQAYMLRHMMPVQVVVLTGPVSEWEQRAQSSRHQFEHGCTNATSTKATADELMFIQQAAHASQSRITLCAWESRRRFVHVHAPFKTSPFPDRDVHYMERYFKYFRQVPR